MIFTFFKPKRLQPFEQFYKKATPEIFIYLFQNELVQTIAFVLSFCKNKKFIRKVLSLMDNAEVSEHIIQYLAICKDIGFDPYTCREIEKWCDKMVEKYCDGEFNLNMRSNVKHILPKALQKENDRLCALGEPLQAMIKPIGQIFNKFQSVMESHSEILRVKEHLKELQDEERRLQDVIHRCRVNLCEIKNLFEREEEGTEDEIEKMFEVIEKMINESCARSNSRQKTFEGFEFPSYLTAKPRGRR